MSAQTFDSKTGFVQREVTFYMDINILRKHVKCMVCAEKRAVRRLQMRINYCAPYSTLVIDVSYHGFTIGFVETISNHSEHNFNSLCPASQVALH